MITLFRWIRLKQLETKWKLAFWQEIDKTANKIMEDPEWLAKNVMPALAKVIHESNQKNKTEQSS